MFKFVYLKYRKNIGKRWKKIESCEKNANPQIKSKTPKITPDVPPPTPQKVMFQLNFHFICEYSRCNKEYFWN